MSSDGEKKQQRKSPAVGRSNVARKSRAKGKPVRPLNSPDLREAVAYLLRLAVEWEGLDEATPKGTGLPKRLRTEAMLQSLVNQLLNHRADRRDYAAQVQVAELVQPMVAYATKYAEATKRNSHEAESILAQAADDLGTQMYCFRLPIPGEPRPSHQAQRRFWVDKVRKILQTTHHKKRLKGENALALRKRVQKELGALVNASAGTLDNHAAARNPTGNKGGAIKSKAELVALRDGLGPDLAPRLRYLLNAEGLNPGLIDAMLAKVEELLRDSVRG